MSGSKVAYPKIVVTGSKIVVTGSKIVVTRSKIVDPSARHNEEREEMKKRQVAEVAELRAAICKQEKKNLEARVRLMEEGNEKARARHNEIMEKRQREKVAVEVAVLKARLDEKKKENEEARAIRIKEMEKEKKVIARCP